MELDAPNVGSIEKRFINKAIDSGYVSTFGPFITEFENVFAWYLRISKAVSTQSGTEAIHIALHELGIGKGDEVIVPALTFIATANPVVYTGAKPVFADVDIKTWNIDPEEIEKRITKKTKAIIPVHFYGNLCDMDRIIKIAKKYDLFIIEDATESLGAKYKGKYAGTLGDLGCFSFNGNKIITTGGGGMVVGRNNKRLEHIKFLVNQARDGSRGYYHPEVGFNYRMTNIEASLGLAQMKRLKEFLKKKKRFNDIYRKELGGVKFIYFQEEYKGAEASWWLSCIRFDKDINIGSLQAELKDKKIPTRRIFTPLTEFPPYKREKKTYRNSYEIYEKGLCLPSSTLNSEDDVYYVCDTLKQLLRGY
ncbi:MAG: aminotransferase class V-fold PLP-dependent enzyme [Candidatus Gorgyraea atricola]|nr:aminotransferase class V-fold PLP-dependent enzyme [Candidatus Gorgyraea atricola]